MDAGDTRGQLEELVELVTKLRKAIDVLEKHADHEGGDVLKHAEVHPRPRQDDHGGPPRDRRHPRAGPGIPADLWPMPTYREMLHIK